jgi:hypothetical protein
MALSYRDTASNAMVDVLTDFLDGGSLEFRTGAKPASPNSAATGTLLATLTFPTPSFGAAASRIATIGHFRAKSSGGTAYVDGTVTTSGGGGDLEVDSLVTVVGQPVEVTGGTWTGP